MFLLLDDFIEEALILCLKEFHILNIQPGQVIDWIAKFIHKDYLLTMKVSFTRFGG
jgi:hypothetical protein